MDNEKRTYANGWGVEPGGRAHITLVAVSLVTLFGGAAIVTMVPLWLGLTLMLVTPAITLMFRGVMLP